MNWKFLSLALLGLTLVACDSKKEEKKAHEAASPEAVKIEEPKASEVMPPETPKEEHKEGHKEEHKAS